MFKELGSADGEYAINLLETFHKNKDSKLLPELEDAGCLLRASTSILTALPELCIESSKDPTHPQVTALAKFNAVGKVSTSRSSPNAVFLLNLNSAEVSSLYKLFKTSPDEFPIPAAPILDGSLECATPDAQRPSRSTKTVRLAYIWNVYLT